MSSRAFLAGLVIAAALAVWISRSQARVAPTLDTASQPDTVSGSTRSLTQMQTSPPVASASPAAPVVTPPSNAPTLIARPTVQQQEQQSLETLATLLSNVVSSDSSPARLVTDLERAGYEPLASRDDEGDLNSMIVIETKNALPGSRYFRAQYFSDEDGNYQPQYISFELRPGTSRAAVTAALTKAFGPLPAPHYQDHEWTIYKLAGGHSLWTKVLNTEDVQENAILPHVKEDIGTIQVAVEKEQPGHED